jgi:AhpD family alkylhydroperoxidase
MQPRVSYEDFVKAAPGAYSGLGALSKSVDESGLDKSLTEFVKLRASQINGCAFCVSFHLNMLRKLGAPREKIDLITVWREAGIFSDRETAALAWTEALTDLSPAGAADEAYAALLAHFSPMEAMFLTVAIGTINNWNRLGVALRFAPLALRAPGP